MPGPSQIDLPRYLLTIGVNLLMCARPPQHSGTIPKKVYGRTLRDDARDLLREYEERFPGANTTIGVNQYCAMNTNMLLSPAEQRTINAHLPTLIVVRLTNSWMVTSDWY
jgi:hypothetical protein